MLTEEIKKIIEEELSINDDVARFSNEFYNEIISKLNNAEIIEKNNLLIKKKISIVSYIDKIKVVSSVIYRNFLSKDFKEKYNLSYITDGGSIFINKGLAMMFINIYAINGTVDKPKSMETIQHEVEHIFQQEKMGHEFGDSNGLYEKIKTDLESKSENKQKLAKLLYLCIKSEQEGFSNGLYAYMMDKQEPYNDDLLTSSETWNLYLTAKENFNELKINDGLKEVFTEYFNLYGITMPYIEKQLNNFLHRIGRTIIKVKKDKLKQGWR